MESPVGADLPQSDAFGAIRAIASKAILFNNNIQQSLFSCIIPVSFKMLYFFTGFKLLLFQFIGIIPANRLAGGTNYQ
jgi:hypothetical protein